MITMFTFYSSFFYYAPIFSFHLPNYILFYIKMINFLYVISSFIYSNFC